MLKQLIERGLVKKDGGGIFLTKTGKAKLRGATNAE
jgi:Mn-dependent DtxR family transcriptional regulator